MPRARRRAPVAERVAIVTDSTASLSAAQGARLDVTVVPLQVILGADVHAEGDDVTSEMIAEALAAFVPVNTSRPTPERFEAAYRAAAEAGATSIVSVHLSAKMSGTYDSASLAAESSPVPVTCVDTLQVGIGTGFAVMRAAEARAGGGDAAAIAEAARRAGDGTWSAFYVDTLEYLKRGGRVGTAAALIGSALAVKPLLTVADGVVQPLEKVRTSARAIARLEALTVEKAQALSGACDVGVQHLAARSTAEAVAGRLATALGRVEVPITEVGAVIGAHVGPGMIAVAVTPR